MYNEHLIVPDYAPEGKGLGFRGLNPKPQTSLKVTMSTGVLLRGVTQKP